MCSFSNCKWTLFKSRKPGTLRKVKGVDRAMVKEAGEELRQAYQTLAQVNEEGMIDYAIFTLQAAEKRYGYLLRKLKEQEKKESLTVEGGEI